MANKMAEKKKSTSRGQMAETNRNSEKALSTRGGKATVQETRKEQPKQGSKSGSGKKGPNALVRFITRYRLGRFALDAYYELRHKVTWPTFTQARNMTLIVIVLSVVVGLFLYGVDWVLAELVFFISGGR